MREWLRAFRSVFFAFLGVQTDENRNRGFEHGRFPVFVAAGVALTVGFIITVYCLVRFAIASLQ